MNTLKFKQNFVKLVFTFGSSRPEFVELATLHTILRFNGILVHVRTSFGLRQRGGETHNVST